jgi:hypothetical protein
MTFGQILDRIFRLLRSHYRPFVAIGALPFGAVIALEAVFFGALYFAGAFQHLPAKPNTMAMLQIMLPMSLLFIPVTLLIYGLYYGASTYSALQADHGFKVTAGEAFGHAWSRIGRYAWLMVLRTLIVTIPIAVCMLAVLAGVLLLGVVPKGNPNSAALFFLIPLAVLLYLGAMVYAILMSLRLSLAFSACVHEDLTAGQAIRRSGVLTHGAKGRIFLVLLVIYAISYAVIMVLYAVGLFVFAIGAVAGVGHLHAASPLTIALAVVACLVAIALMLLWTVLLMAAYSIAFAIIYRDQCLRKDGRLFPAPAQPAEPV